MSFLWKYVHKLKYENRYNEADPCMTSFLNQPLDKNGPSTREIDLVDSQQLLAISIANASVNVMVEDDRAGTGVHVQALTTRSIDVTVAGEDLSTTVLAAVNTVLINPSTCNLAGSADHDLVFLALGRTVLVEVTAGPAREEEIVVAAPSEDKGTLRRTRGGAVVLDIVRRAANLQGRVVHGSLVDVAPEGAKVHVESRAVPDQVAIDGVVGGASLGGDAGSSVVGPGSHIHRVRGCNTNGRVLSAKFRGGVVHVVGIADLGDIRSLQMLLVSICCRSQLINLPRDQCCRQSWCCSEPCPCRSTGQ